LVRPFPFVTLSFRALLLTLLAVDFAFILTNVLAVLAFDASLIKVVPRLLKVTEDLALPEDFNYLKWLVIAVALLWLAVRDRWLAPLLWAAVFTMILADDALQVHETLGKWLSQHFAIADNGYMGGSDFGELAVFGLMGLFTLSVLGILFSRKDRPTRQMSFHYLMIIVFLGGIGVGLDAIHSLISHLTGTSSLATVLQQLFGMAEDGGEMLIGSLAVALTLAPAPAETEPLSHPRAEKA
jgi:hypothetical protein